MRYADLFESRLRTLYHGTLVDYVPGILKHGLKPQVGTLTTKWYGDRDVPMKPYVFAADAHGLEKCINVIAKQLRIKYGEDKNLSGIFQKEAALLIIRAGPERHGFGMTPWDNDKFMATHYGLPLDQFDKAFERAPTTSEPGDYWTRKKVKVDAVLTGQRLMDFLRRQPSIWLWTWEDIDPGIMLAIARPRVVAALLQELGPQAKDAILRTVASLDAVTLLRAIGRNISIADAIPDVVDLVHANMRGQVISEAMSPFASWRRWWGNSVTGELVPVAAGEDHDAYLLDNINDFLTDEELAHFGFEGGDEWELRDHLDPILEMVYAKGWQAILYDGEHRSLMARVSGDSNAGVLQRITAKVMDSVPVEVLHVDRVLPNNRIMSAELSGRPLDLFLKTGRINPRAFGLNEACSRKKMTAV